MTADLMLALIGFAFVASISPGPGNFLLLASGLNFGFRRTLPLVLGISLGFLLILFLVGLGAGAVLAADERVFMAMRALGAAFVLWLAWRIATAPVEAIASAGEQAVATARPIGFVQGGLLQWLNPKAWAVALATTVTYVAPEGDLAARATGLALLIAVFFVVNLPSLGVWAAAGVLLRRLLAEPRRLKVFNLVMAALLVASTLPVVLGLVG